MTPQPLATPAAATNAEPAIFLRNMGALWRADAVLAQRIDDLPLDAGLAVEASRSGPPTAAAPTDDGRRIYLHSRYDPVKEAERLVAGVDLDDTFCFVVTGFGLGYHVRELFGHLRGDAFIIVSEPDLTVLKTALENVDLHDLLASKKCIFLTEATTAELHNKLENVNTTMLLGAKFVTHPPSNQTAGAFQSAMRSQLADFFAYGRMSLVTLAANARITCRNVANNLPKYVATSGIGALRNRFRGCPAVIVSAGPSIRRNMHRLAEARNGAVVIAVQTMYKTLLDMDLVPDFVTSLDYHEISRKFFEGVEDTGHTCLVAEPKASWHTIDAFNGPVRLLENTFAQLCLGDDLAARGRLKAGATVAHLAFYLAEHLGCDPIIFVGQDLGYSGSVYYAPGVPIHDLWRPETNRFRTLEMLEWERIVRGREILRRIQDVDGHDIYTDEQMYTYLQQFERDFAATPARVIDATEGGAIKRGTERMTFADAIAQYCDRSIPDALRYASVDGDGQGIDRLRAARDVVQNRLDEIDGFRDLCTETLDVLEALKGLLDRPREFNRKLALVDALRIRVRRQARICHMVSAVSQLTEIRRFSADRRLEVVDHDSPERAVRQLQRDVNFIGGLKTASDDLTEILTESLARFDDMIAAT